MVIGWHQTQQRDKFKKSETFRRSELEVSEEQSFEAYTERDQASELEVTFLYSAFNTLTGLILLNRIECSPMINTTTRTPIPSARDQDYLTIFQK